MKNANYWPDCLSIHKPILVTITLHSAWMGPRVHRKKKKKKKHSTSFVAWPYFSWRPQFFPLWLDFISQISQQPFALHFYLSQLNLKATLRLHGRLKINSTDKWGLNIRDQSCRRTTPRSPLFLNKISEFL